MDVEFMLKIMEANGPLDWRHAMTHGMYWATRGYYLGGGLKTERNLDLLNVLRNDIYNLQEICFNGVVLFDPIEYRLNRSYVPINSSTAT